MKLGKIGDQVEVKNGFGRNYLLRQGKALRASKENIELVSKKKSELNQKNEDKSDEFVVNCYSYEKLYKVRYEALRKHIFGKVLVDDQSE